MNKSAEQSIISFLKENPQKYASAELQRMIFKNRNGTTAIARSLVRRLEENTRTQENPTGVLEVSYVNGNAYYQISEGQKKKPVLVIDESLPPIRVNGIWKPVFRYA